MWRYCLGLDIRMCDRKLKLFHRPPAGYNRDESLVLKWLDVEQNLALLLAQHRVQAYVENSHLSVSDRVARLRQGLDSYRWLRRAEETMREAACEGLMEFDPAAQAVLHQLYTQWLQHAENLVHQISAGVQNTRPDEEDVCAFQQAVEEVQELIDRSDWQRRTAFARTTRLASEIW